MKEEASAKPRPFGAIILALVLGFILGSISVFTYYSLNKNWLGVKVINYSDRELMYVRINRNDIAVEIPGEHVKSILGVTGERITQFRYLKGDVYTISTHFADGSVISSDPRSVPPGCVIYESVYPDRIEYKIRAC